MQKVAYAQIVTLARPLTYLSTLDNRLAAWIVYWVQNTFVTPNTLTALSLFLHVCACVCVFVFSDVVSLLSVPVLLFCAYTLDNADGILARLSGTSSPFGAFFDASADRTKDVLALFVLGLLSGSVLASSVALASFALFLGVVLSRTSYPSVQKSADATTHKPSRLRYSAAEYYLVYSGFVLMQAPLYGLVFFSCFFLAQAGFLFFQRLPVSNS